MDADTLLAERLAIQRALVESGFVATRRVLLAAGPRAALEALLDDGQVVRVARGRYADPSVDGARRAAHALAGVAAYQSAALAHAWPVLFPPSRPQLVVGRGRKVAAADRERYAISWRTLSADDIDPDGWFTSATRTVLDSAGALPFREGLAIADSALRSGRVTRSDLDVAATRLVPFRRQRILRVLREARGLAAGPFESALRALCTEVDGLTAEPQVHIPEPPEPFLARVDLADRRLRIVIEAESVEFHASSAGQLQRDCTRYTELGVRGWLVLRFTYRQVVFQPEWVLTMLRAAVASRAGTGGRPTLGSGRAGVCTPSLGQATNSTVLVVGRQR